MEIRTPPNPIKDLRESFGLTQKALAELADITPQRVLREEQFVYVEPSDSILKALSEFADRRGIDLDVEELAAQYITARSKFQVDFLTDLRSQPFYADTVKRVFEFVLDNYDAQPGVLRSPVRMFRENLFEHFGIPNSAIKFSIYTGMHPGTLSDIETGKTDWDGAGALIDILGGIDIPPETIRQLGVLHDNYFVRRVI